MLRWSTILLAMSLGLLGCKQSNEQPEDIELETKPLGTDPTAERPTIYFPRDSHTEDTSLNKFVEDSLNTAQLGDYDRFRQLFASSATPPEKPNFERIWHGVKSIEVVSVHADREEPPTYYVHIAVTLKRPDDKQRTRLDGVMAVFREEGEYRLAPASREITAKVLLVDGKPPGGSSASQPSATRPALPPGV